MNAPLFLTSFVGRDDAVRDVSDLLARYRLITLVGPGGVGKTRLAVETARRRGALAFVDLAAVTEAGHLSAAFAAGLAIKHRSDDEAVVALLSSADGVLVIDNAEHLLDPLARFARRILSRAPAVTLLVTSRHPLGVEGEIGTAARVSSHNPSRLRRVLSGTTARLTLASGACRSA